MAKREVVIKRLQFREDALAELEKAYMALLSGQVQSYTIGSRSLSRLNLNDLREEMRILENEIDSLEEQLRNGHKRKAVGVVPRDW